MNDRTTRLVTLLLAVAFAVSPFFSSGFGGFSPESFPVQVDRWPAQPAGWAFSIWGLIYLWLIGASAWALWRPATMPHWGRAAMPLSLSLFIGAFWVEAAMRSPPIATVMILIMAPAAILALLRARESWREWAPLGLYAGWLTAATEWHVNPTGKFVIGGPDGDAGLTGRKIIVDTYGGAAPHGGGAFSGKDPTKVDRSAAYAARYLAKNVVAAGMAGKCTLQLSYAIGVSRPLSIYVDTHQTGNIADAEIEKAVAQVMDLTPRGIREHLQLNRPIYTRTAAYGHFGRDPEADGGFSWERTDLAEALKRAV